MSGKTISTDTVVICVWPDGEWCHKEEVEYYIWKSDDYEEIKIPASMSDEGIDTLIGSCTKLSNSLNQSGVV